MDELQAIRRLKQGDIGGLECLVSRYQVCAARAALLITQNDPLTEDIVQESFVRLYYHIRHFDETHPFEPYFIQSVVNAALNAVEKKAGTFRSARSMRMSWKTCWLMPPQWKSKWSLDSSVKRSWLPCKNFPRVSVL